MSTVFDASRLSSSKNPVQFEQKMGWQIGDIVAVGIERASNRKRQAENRQEAPRSNVLPTGWDVRYTAFV